MAEQMTELQLMLQERTNSGTAWTRNEKFEKDGYLVVKDLWDPEELYHPVPEEKGQYNYWDKNPEHFNHVPVESTGRRFYITLLASTISCDSLWYSYETGGNHRS